MKGILVAVLALAIGASALATPATKDPLIERGRYLVGYGSCNDCHTPGWRESDGAVPVDKWMTGSNLGYRGPWGTSYAANVRLDFSRITGSQWLFMVQTRGGHWPMVWQDLRFLSVDDQLAIYHFIRSLGPKGVPAPSDVPPSRDPTTPYIWIVPHS